MPWQFTCTLKCIYKLRSLLQDQDFTCVYIYIQTTYNTMMHNTRLWTLTRLKFQPPLSSSRNTEFTWTFQCKKLWIFKRCWRLRFKSRGHKNAVKHQYRFPQSSLPVPLNYLNFHIWYLYIFPRHHKLWVKKNLSNKHGHLLWTSS